MCLYNIIYFLHFFLINLKGGENLNKLNSDSTNEVNEYNSIGNFNFGSIFNKSNINYKIILALLIVFISCLAISSSLDTLNAVDITNSTTGGIKSTVDNAASGTTIYLASGVYSGTNSRDITINKSITIIGRGNVTIDAGTAGRHFNITSSGSLTLINVTLKNGLTHDASVYYNAIRGVPGGSIKNLGTL
ncbi:MAG: hypothetical protein LBR24_03005, partial [Methanobrevibacter sp.]|nr:hypothetical protein [Methanobrevibacter sp.]